jgi:hypothetical protein
VVIRTFRDKNTEALFRGERVGRFQTFRAQAERKLIMLEAARRLTSLASEVDPIGGTTWTGFLVGSLGRSVLLNPLCD